MKVSHCNKVPERKIVGYVGASGCGLYLKTCGEDSVTYISTLNASGNCMIFSKTLEEIGKDNQRQPIYEGDKITIEF